MIRPSTKIQLKTNLPLILTVPEVAGILCVSQKTVKRMVRDGQIDSITEEKETQILRDDLIFYLSKHSNL